jgi:hypothetical protein
MENPPAVRAGDADRARALVLLRDATVSGHLTLDEFSERIERAELARTHAELEAVTADLPARAGEAALPARHSAIFSRLQRSGRWQLAPESKVLSVGGTIELDLGRATLQARETTLHVRNYFGTITLLVPRGVVVDVDGGGTFGTRDIDLPDGGPVEDAPRLHIHTSGPFGTLRIRPSPRPG